MGKISPGYAGLCFEHVERGSYDYFAFSDVVKRLASYAKCHFHNSLLTELINTFNTAGYIRTLVF